MLHRTKLLARRQYLRSLDSLRRAVLISKKARQAALAQKAAQQESEDWEIYLFNKGRFKLWVQEVEFDRALLVQEEVLQQLDQDVKEYRSKEYAIEQMQSLLGYGGGRSASD
jgi:hypothetical protein